MDPVTVPSIPATSFPLPPRLEGLRRLAYNVHWAWSPRTRNLWTLIDRAARTRYRNPVPVISARTAWTRLLADGPQEHNCPVYDIARLPLARVQDANGMPLRVSVELPGRDLVVAVWLAQVGRIPVLLLDTDVADNAVEDRPITHILYVRGREM